MTGWNMPPGVSERDVPGNRAEDQRSEHLMAEIDKVISAARERGMARHEVVEVLQILREDYDTPGTTE